MSQSSPTRREKEKIRIQEQILYAAQQLFEERGLEAVTMEDIALKSEFAKGTLYNYFKNKNVLISELILQNLTRLRQVTESIVSKNIPFSEKLSAFVFHILTSVESEKVLFKLITPKKFFLYDEEGKIRAFVFQHMQSLCALCESGIQEGALKPMNPLLLASSLMGNIKVFAEFCTEQDSFASMGIEEKKKIVIDLFMKGAGHD